MLNLNTSDGAIRALMILLLVPLISIGTILFQSKNDIEIAKHNWEIKQNELNSLDKELIQRVINEKRIEAKKNTIIVKNIVINDLLTSYHGRMDQLKIDLNSNENNEAREILNNSIDGNHMFKNNYNNRMWIANSDGVIADRSIISANDKQNRTWEEEYKHSINENLLKNAISKISNKVNNELIYIDGPFMDWDCPTDDMYIYPSFENLFKIYSNGNKSSINRYNIIECSYIHDSMDIFGVPDVDQNGIKVQNDMLIVVQQFNLGDALDEYSEIFKSYEQLRQTNKEQLEAYCISTFNHMITIVAIMILSFIAILSSVFLYRNWGEWQHGNNAS